MEVEAKFAITAAIEPATLDGLDLHPYTLHARGVEEHTDTLLDTADRRITRRLHALRVRATDGALTLTLKGPNTGEGGVHVRQEWEAPLTPPLALDPGAWPEPIASKVTALTGGEALIPLLHVSVERRLWAVRRGSRLTGELALDTGVILAAGRREAIHELELELKGSGARADLDTLSDRLIARLPLQPETRSKLQRGLALLAHARWSLDGYTPIVALGRHYIRQKLRAAQSAMRDVADSGNPDSIHDMRVAVRRIRSALLEMEGIDAFDRRSVRKLRKRLRGIARSLGAVRDLDIIMERIVAHAPEGDSDGEIASAIAHLQSRRREAYLVVQRQIASARFARLLKLLHRGGIARMAADSQPDSASARGYAGGVLWTRYDALTRHDTAIVLGDMGEMHQARIAAKRLRYVLELFAPALGPDIAPLRQALVAFQESFGALQDITVTIQALEATPVSGPRSPAWSALARELEVGRAKALAKARDVWGRLSASEIREALARAVSAL